MTALSIVARSLSCATLALLAFSPAPAFAEGPHPRGGQVLTPGSSIEDPNTIGQRMHTHLRVFVPAGGMDSLRPPRFSDVHGKALAPAGAPANGYFYIETPASLACVYKLAATTLAGCNPYSVAALPTGGARAIAIVDAYDDATAATDLATFSTQFGLPPASFQVVYASGKKPAADSGWNLEEALDVEWAHAMAPKAKIYLVEAASSSGSDLYTAVTVAGRLVQAAGGGEVSMSWGGSEFNGETQADGYFVKSGVVFVASAGDSPGVEYPSASPNVVAVGGTSLSRNPVTGNFQQELSWQQTGGGPSAYEPRPAYQSGVTSITGASRGVPDVAAIADPTTGVWVYQGGQWGIVGGTSVAAPVWAGIINAAGHFSTSSAAELTLIYSNTAGYTTVADGDCGPYEGYLATAPWNFCTGHGSPLAMLNK